MTTSNKDTIYIDIDEEITGIIDKVRSSEGKIVALVLPKRASVLQSIVNMKLLKRSADEAKKNLVLITSEAGLMPLAGAVGLHVAKTPQSKPEIPTPPVDDDTLEETINESDTDPEDFSAALAANKPVGELAGLGAAGAIDDMETVQLDDDGDEIDAAPIAAPVAAAKVKKNSKLAVPNFERFRILLVLGGVGLVLLIVGLYFALAVLPKAQIAVTTNATDVNVGLDLSLNTAAKTADATTKTIPAKLAQTQKTNTQQAPATGTKNTGDKATGAVVFYNCNKDDRLFAQGEVIPSGTGVSSNSLTYITQESVTVPPSSFKKDGTCNKDASSSDVKIIAQAGGANYNLPDRAPFSVAYANPSDGSKSFSGVSSGAVSGGTDTLVKVVTQSDIDAAKQKIQAADSSVKLDLRKQLEQTGYYALTSSYAAGVPAETDSAQPGAVADNVTVTQTITYTMFGFKQTDLKGLVDADVKKQIDTSKQSILNEGLNDAIYKVANATDTTADLNVQTVATAGPDLNADQIKTQVAGKKGGDIKRLLQASPGVTDVQVKLSPFWVTSVPKKTTKITVTIGKPTAATPSNNAVKP